MKSTPLSSGANAEPTRRLGDGLTGAAESASDGKSSGGASWWIPAGGLALLATVVFGFLRFLKRPTALLCVAGMLFLALAQNQNGLAQASAAPGAKADEVERWAKFCAALQGVTNATWRDFLKGMQAETAKTGAVFPKFLELAWTRAGQVGRRDAMEEFRGQEEALEKPEKSWRGLVGWAAKDPEGARNWWSQLSKWKYRERLTTALIWGLAQAGEDHLIGFYVGQSEGVQLMARDDAPKALVENYGWESAMRLFEVWHKRFGERHPGTDAWLFGSVLRARIAAAEAEGKPEAACQWLMPHSGAKYLDPMMVEHAVASWAKIEPRKAFDWALAFKNGETFPARPLVITAAAALAEKSPAEVDAWMREHLDSKDFDSVLFGLVKATAPKNLAEALRLAELAENPKAREQMTAAAKYLASEKK